MAKNKKRVYELARELNLTNKALLEKISDLDLGISSHMSTLDEETEARIRAHLLGGPKTDMEVTRVKPTVIRRRRRKVKPAEAEPAGPAEEAEAEKEKQQEPEKPEEAEPESVAAIEPEPEAPEPAAVEPEPSEPEKQEQEPVAEDEAAATAAGEAEKAPEAEAAQEAPAGQKTAEEPAPAAAPPEEKAAEPEKPEKPEKDVKEKAKPVRKKAEPARAKKRKTAKDTPAKIIKLPERKPEPAPEVRQPVRKAPASPDMAAPPPPPPAHEGRKKGKKKKGFDEERDRKFLKKKISFRRKEVVEGAALYSGKRGRKGRKGAKGRTAAPAQRPQITTAKAIKRRIKIDETIVLSDLAKRMGIKANEMIAKLMGLGVMATVNQTIDFDTAALVAAEFNYEVEKATFEEEAILKTAEVTEDDRLEPRPPVVTIMGHVDHGKTSLLDVIRKSRITAGEAGGITQHIGAYMVSTSKGDIAFLDTPGHEAFSAMRSRGAKVTDIVVLVVAADDGVMPQTVEAINHARAAGVPLIVAVNKIDKPNADPDKVQRQLAELGVVPEEWGGDTIFVKVSAKEKTGIDELLEMILLQAEILELRANPNRLATGHVVEAKLDSGRGPVATVLVNNGTLKTGDPVVCGVHYGKIRALINDRGQRVEKAGPSMPVEIIGLSGVPVAGDEMVALKDEKDAKQISMHRIQKQRARELAKTSRLSLDKLYEKMQQGEVKELNVIIKTDVDGSLEAIRDSLLKLSNDEVSINIVHAATGTITESDISLATVSNAIIIGFNVRPNAKVQEMAAEENVDIRYHNIIYNVIKEIKDAIVGMMESTYEERTLGRAEVRQVFHIPKVGAIAGCYVTDGKIERGQMLRLIRDGIVTYEGKAASLRRFKDDVKEVQSGYECGIGIENYNDIKVGDVIECYYLEEIKPELD